MKLHDNQNGFSGLELLLIVAVVLVVAGIGSYVYSKHHGSGGSLFGSNKTATPVVYNGSANSSAPNGIPAGAGGSAGSSASGSSSSSSSSTNQTVIQVAAAGFQISVPDSIKDLTYHVSTSGTTSTVTFSTSSLTAAIPACSATSSNGAFDTVVRGPGTYQANPSGGLLKQFNGYYLAYVLPKGPCAKNLSPQNQSLLDAQAQDFYTALSTVQAI